MKKTARLDDAEMVGSILRLGAEMADDFSTHLGGKAEDGPAFFPETEVRWASVVGEDDPDKEDMSGVVVVGDEEDDLLADQEPDRKRRKVDNKGGPGQEEQVWSFINCPPS